MKRRFLSFAVIVIFVFCCFSFIACGENGAHKHNFITHTDEVNHWEQCDCGKIKGEKSEHSFDAQNICSVCKYKKPPRETYDDFKKFRKEFDIEGLGDGAIPQGFAEYYGIYQTFDDEGATINKSQHIFLMSAYMKDGSPSRIYVTGSETGYIGYVTMLNEDGTLHTGHIRGIATNASRLWVTYGDSILVAQASEKYKDTNILKEIVEKADKNKHNGEELSIQFTASFKANCNAAYLYYFNDPRYVTTSYDRLYVGEYHSNDDKTAESHHLKTSNGYENTSFMYEYRVNSNSSNKYGLDLLDNNNTNNQLSENVPKIQKIYSLPEKVRGIAFSGRTGYGTTTGTLVLSQSYGLEDSHILCFDWTKVHVRGVKYTNIPLGANDTRASFEYEGVYIVNGEALTPYSDANLQVYYVDKADGEMFTSDYEVPPMAGAMCTLTLLGSSTAVQDRIYMLFESGSQQFDLADFVRIKNVYSFIPKTPMK